MPPENRNSDKDQAERPLKESLGKGEKLTVRQVGHLFRLAPTRLRIAAVVGLLLVLALSFTGGMHYKTPVRFVSARPVKYHIKFEKDDRNVQVIYDLSVPVGGPDLIGNVQFSVEGKNLINDATFVHGQTRFNGTINYLLPRADQDASVSFSIDSNQGWKESATGKLRGDKRYDDVSFFN